MNSKRETNHKTIKGGCVQGSGNSHISQRRYPEWPIRRDSYIGIRIVRNPKQDPESNHN